MYLLTEDDLQSLATGIAVDVLQKAGVWHGDGKGLKAIEALPELAEKRAKPYRIVRTADLPEDEG